MRVHSKILISSLAFAHKSHFNVLIIPASEYLYVPLLYIAYTKSNHLRYLRESPSIPCGWIIKRLDQCLSIAAFLQTGPCNYHLRWRKKNYNWQNIFAINVFDLCILIEHISAREQNGALAQFCAIFCKAQRMAQWHDEWLCIYHLDAELYILEKTIKNFPISWHFLEESWWTYHTLHFSYTMILK